MKDVTFALHFSSTTEAALHLIENGRAPGGELQPSARATEHYRRIFLPATQQFPRGRALTENLEHSVLPGQFYCDGASCTSTGKSRTLRHVEVEIPEFAHKMLLDSVRNELRTKRLPSYTIRRSVKRWQHSEGTTWVQIDAVSDCPKEMAGSYIILTAQGASVEATKAKLKRQVVAWVGATEVREFNGSYKTRLIMQNRGFEWLLGRTGAWLLDPTNPEAATALRSLDCCGLDTVEGSLIH